MGPYSADVARMLSAQYRAMDIERVGESADRVTLKSMAAPMPIDLILEGKQWKIDPTPIIVFRKMMAK